MGWRADSKYYYSVRLLRYLSEHWDSLYENGIEFSEENADYNSFSIAEHRASFKWGLDSLSKRMRKVIEADREGIPDFVLEQRGYWDVKKFRRSAFHYMKMYLNREE